ncbi:MAG: lipopolysaccharide biosynthesis protein [Acidobacteriota bacterium]
MLPTLAEVARLPLGQTLVRETSLLSAAQGALMGSRALTLLLLARHVTPLEFDACALYTASTSTLGALCDLGLNVTALKFSAEAPSDESRATALRGFFVIRAAVAAVAAIAVWLLAGPLCAVLLQRSDFAPLLRLASGVALVGSFSSFSLMLLQADLEFGKIAQLHLLSAAAQLAGLAAFFLLRIPGLEALLLGDLLSRLVVVLLTYCAVGSLLRRVGKQRILSAGRVITFAAWINLSTAIGLIFLYLPTVILSRLDKPAALGAYCLGATLAGPFTLVLNAIMSISLPRALSARSNADQRAYLRTIGRGTLGAAAMGVPAVLLVRFGAAVFIAPHHLDSLHVMELLAVGTLVLLVVNPVQFLLYALDRPQWCTAGDLAIAGLFGLLAGCWAPSLGAIGVAWALLTAQSTVKILMGAMVLALVRQRQASGVSTVK